MSKDTGAIHPIEAFDPEGERADFGGGGGDWFWFVSWLGLFLNFHCGVCVHICGLCVCVWGGVAAVDVCVCGVYVVCMWCVCGVYVVCMWCVCGVYVVCMCVCVCGVCVWCVWFVDGGNIRMFAKRALVVQMAVYLTSYSDCLTSFHQPLLTLIDVAPV